MHLKEMIVYFVVMNILILIILVCKREKYEKQYYNYDIDHRHVKKWKERLLKYPEMDLSCHETRKGDKLQMLNASLIRENSIFFIETSCMGYLSSRLACAVESAARANKDRQVFVLFSSSVSAATLNSTSILRTLQRSYKNLKFVRVLIKDLVKSTPIHSFVHKLNKFQLDKRTPRILKFLLLYKFGGIYLSFDVIVAKRFDLCDTWFVKDTPQTYSVDMFAFSRSEVGKKLAEAALRLLVEPLVSLEENWSYDTTSIISQIVVLNTFGINATSCKELGFEVYEPDKFYPLNFYERDAYFWVGEQKVMKKKDVYTYHTYYRFTKHRILTSMSFYGKIAQLYCPVTFKYYNKNFGS